MTIPGFILGTVIGVLYGALFHFWKGGGLIRLGLYVLLSLSGFWIGHFIAATQSIDIYKIGVLDIGVATISSAVFLGTGYWLSLIEIHKAKTQ